MGDASHPLMAWWIHLAQTTCQAQALPVLHDHWASSKYDTVPRSHVLLAAKGGYAAWSVTERPSAPSAGGQGTHVSSRMMTRGEGKCPTLARWLVTRANSVRLKGQSQKHTCHHYPI